MMASFFYGRRSDWVKNTGAIVACAALAPLFSAIATDIHN